ASKATVSGTASATLTFSLVPASGTAVAFDRQEVAAGAHVLTGSVVGSEYFQGRGRYRVVASVGGAQVGSPLAFDVTRPLVQPAVFRDVTAASGIRTTTSLGVCGDWSSGAAWGDGNGDGRP